MKTLEQYFKDNNSKTIDHMVRASVNSDGTVTFYIHPHGADGDTLDFSVSGNQLTPKNQDQERWKNAIDNARFMLEEYKKIPTGAFGAVTIARTIARYDNGERTNELLEELEGIQ